MVWRIQQPLDELQSLLVALGVYDVPAVFGLSEVVSPVSIVDSRITLTANTAPIVFTSVSSAGVKINPAINTILADTGALAAGTYDFKVWVMFQDSAVLTNVEFQHRDAANAANVWTQRLTAGNSAAVHVFEEFELALTFAQSERLRVIVSAATTATSQFDANIFTRLR